MFRTSKLTQQESYKFQATLYRFWLFSRIYGCWKYEREPDFTDEEEDQDQDDNSMMFAAVKKRHDFLQNFSTQELAELEKVVHFLEDTAGWAMRSNWEELREHQGEGPSKLIHSLRVEPLANLEHCCRLSHCHLSYKPIL